MLRKICLPLLLAMSVLNPIQSLAQKRAPQKFNDAIKRSESAAEVIGRVAQLSQNGIPRELIDKVEAVGVFPCKKTDVLIEHAVVCPGVLSRHLEKTWSLPVFFKFGGGGFGRPDPALRQSVAMILLFMDKESLGWLDRATAFGDKRQAIAGFAGTLTREQADEMTKAHVIVYAVRKDGLTGENLKGRVWRAVGLSPDNNINQALYGVKGREVLAGKEIPSNAVPTRISAFQQALQKYYGR